MTRFFSFIIFKIIKYAIIPLAILFVFWVLSSSLIFPNLFPKDKLFSLLFNKQNVFAQEKQEKNDILDKEAFFLSNQLLVKFKKESVIRLKEEGNPNDTGIASIDQIHQKYGIKGFKRVSINSNKSKKDSDLFSWYLVTGSLKEEKISGQFFRKKRILESSDSEAQFLQQLIASYLSDPNIETAEPNFIVTTQNTPNDPYYFSSGSWGQLYPDLWGMKKLNLELAWDQSTGSTNVVVADIDTGVDRNHEDLANNTWVNNNEIPNNNKDDDGNGYIDDYYGWDFANNDNDPVDDHGHGTHTAGTIAGVGNNGLGVVGVNWQSKIMAVKFLNSGGSGTIENGAKALQYAADMGAKVSSNSWACNCQSALTEDAVKYEHEKGMAVVVAAGNGYGQNALDYSPASADRAITVSASDPNDIRASFSNIGEKIDVAAPGVDTLSVKSSINNICGSDKTVGTNYCRLSGTSMATPHVAGLTALLLSRNPSLTNEEVRQIIRLGVIDLAPTGKDANFGYGRIDASNSMNLTATKPLAPIITIPQSRTTIYGASLQIFGSADGTNFSDYTIELGYGRSPQGWKNLASSSNSVTNGVLAAIDTTKLFDGSAIFRLTAKDTNGRAYQFQIHDVVIDNFDAEISFPSGFTSKGNVEIVGSADTKSGLAFANYKIEWGEGASPAVWLVDGITLINGGTQPVNNEKLGIWDTSGLADGQVYTLRLMVTALSGVSNQYQSSITIDKDLVSGWPKFLDTTGQTFAEATPALADLNGDGSKEIVVLAPGGKIHVFRKDGSNFPGFPVTIPDSNYYFNMPVSIDDLDNDGKKEIIASAYNYYWDGWPHHQRKIYVVRFDGSFYPRWPSPVLSMVDTADGTPAVADLNRDGMKDLVMISGYGSYGFSGPQYFTLHAYQLNGTELSGFPKTFSVPEDIFMYGAPVVSDMDRDGRNEIAWGLNSKLYLFNSSGAILPNWPYTAPLFNGVKVSFNSPPAFGDIDGDGNLELFALGYSTSGQSPIYGLEKDGSVLPGWPQTAAGSIVNGNSPINSPGTADIDQDGKDEIVVATNGLRVYNLQGLKFSQAYIGYGGAMAPAISDLNGDGRMEMSSVNPRRVGLVNDIGQNIWGRNFPQDLIYFEQPSVFADLDNNGKMEYSVFKGPFNSGGATGYLYLWEYPSVNTIQQQLDWPMFLHDSARTGRLPVNPLPSPPPEPPQDTTPPYIMITSPNNNSTVPRNKSITIAATASDNVAVSKVEFYVNSVLQCTDTISPYNCVWKVPGKANVIYTIQAVAYDTSANNSANSVKVTSK